LFGNMAFGGGSTPQASLGVLNHDDGWLSEAIVAELGRDEQFALTHFTPAEFDSTEDKVRTLILPDSFTTHVLAGEQQELRLRKEQGANEDYSLAAEVHVLRTIVRTTGRLLEMDQAGSLLDSLEVDETVIEAFHALGEREPLVGLEVSTAGSGRPVPTGRAQSVPGILTMTVLMMTIIYGAVFLTTEKKDGTLRRQMTLPVGREHVFVGKLLGRFLFAGLQALVLVLAGRFLFGVSFGESPLALLLLMMSYVIACGGLATLMGAVLRTPEQAGSLGWIFSMALAALGGCWWPAEIMPRWLWQSVHVLPTAWAMDGFHALISFGRGLDGVLLPSAVLLLFGLVFSLLGVRFLRVTVAGT
jgi:ABC-type Na+ efflux pump permease subunit